MRLEFTFFKPSGKYYTAEVIEITVNNATDLYFVREKVSAVLEQHRLVKNSGMLAVCLDSEQLGYPILIKK